MRGVWKNKLGLVVDNHQKQCLFGFAKDMVEHCPGVDPVAVFAHALDHWDGVAFYIRQAELVEKCKHGYEIQFKEFQRIPSIRRWYKAVTHAYVAYLQWGGNARQTGRLKCWRR
jgi:hypothetical protein